MKVKEQEDLAYHIADTFNLNAQEVKDCIHDYYSDIATEVAECKCNVDIGNIDEQEDLTNCQI